MKKVLGSNITRRRHTCDCGFQWLSGNDGSHNCSDHYRKKIKALQEEKQAALDKAQELERDFNDLFDEVEEAASCGDSVGGVLRNYRYTRHKE